MITCFGHSCFVSADVDRAAEFYCNKLGLSITFERKNPEGRRTWIYIHIGQRNFLEIFEGGGRKHFEGLQNYGHMCLEVDDIQATVAECKSRGVTFISDPELGTDNCWQAWLQDPDGNKIELMQYTETSWQMPSLKTLR